MLKFISQILMMFSLGTIVYLFARTLPRIDENEAKKISTKSHRIFYYVEKIDEWLKTFFEKTLRKAGIVLLKLENQVNTKITNLKKRNNLVNDSFFPDGEKEKKNENENKA